MNKTHILKIKECYLASIRKGVKKHEYRLGSPDRRKIHVGDTLVLKNVDDSNDYVEVRVTNVELYASWKEALKNYWKDDFKDIYVSLEETIDACSQFYKEDDVKQYGVIVFTISLI